MPRTMAYTIFRRQLFLVVHKKDNPDDEEWNQYVEYSRKNLGNFTCTMILSEGGGPNTLQRGALNDMLEAANYKGKVAVVSLSSLVRGIVTALGWFNPNIKAFSTLQVPLALTYLGFSKEEQEGVLLEIKRMRKDLGLPA